MDLIVLIFLVFHIGKKAKEKGLNAGAWRLRLVLTWLLFEFTGFVIGAQLFHVNIDRLLAGKMEEFSGLALFSFVCGFGGYLLIKYRLDKMPANLNDETNDNGNN
ncbi:MAG: hypothetical protein QM737_08590 [Ferruginibacter sp.]